MIKSFKSEELAKLYKNADRKKLPAALVPKIERVLARLDIATAPDAMNLPGFRLHNLQGKLKGFYSIAIAGNYRIIFCFREHDVWDVGSIDYH